MCILEPILKRFFFSPTTNLDSNVLRLQDGSNAPKCLPAAVTLFTDLSPPSTGYTPKETSKPAF